ncbi:bifunctional 3-oxoadipate enol-lactonase/4-carboxymuconolactone decarboxylase PcaDC [Spirosoma aerolatum]|nr:3-oxoadipate enol-lactonase [Spirosoma aerolatum]
MAYLQINGNAIHYQLEGLEQGPVLLFSNSLGSDLTMWNDVVEPLRSHFRILRYDTTGHGQTPPSQEPISIADLGQDVLGLLDALGIAQVNFCGLSMGGLIGQWLAVHHPDRINKLVLCNTAARIGTVNAWSERINTVSQQGISAIADAVLNRWLTDGFQQANPESTARLLTMVKANTAEGHVACSAVLRDTDLRATIHHITAPTLIIAGTYDPVTTVSDGQFMQQEIPNAQLCELSAAHMSVVEKADAVVQLLLAFLEEPATQSESLASGPPTQSTYEQGMTVRRAVLGDAHVDRANAGLTDFNADFQDFITRYAWGEIWTRPGLTRHSRSLITLGMLIALNRETEFKMHVRAAFNNGVTLDELKEVIMHSALYCGLPAANAAFQAAQEIINERQP